MRIQITISQIDFFQTHGFIIFEKIGKSLNIKELGKIATELLRRPSLRLIWKEEVTHGASCALKEISCVQGVVGGALLSLDEGWIYFFNDEFEIPFHQIKGKCLFLVFGELDSLFIHNQKSPWNQKFKDLGYSYGDRLKEANHPIIYQKM